MTTPEELELAQLRGAVRALLVALQEGTNSTNDGIHHITVYGSGFDEVKALIGYEPFLDDPPRVIPEMLNLLRDVRIDSSGREVD